VDLDVHLGLPACLFLCLFACGGCAGLQEKMEGRRKAQSHIPVEEQTIKRTANLAYTSWWVMALPHHSNLSAHSVICDRPSSCRRSDVSRAVESPESRRGVKMCLQDPQMRKINPVTLFFILIRTYLPHHMAEYCTVLPTTLF
jgi:hypothetical protein